MPTYLPFQTASISDGTNTYSATSIEYNDTAEIIKIKNTRTSGKTQFLTGYLESDFSCEFDYDDTQTLPIAGSSLTVTGTLDTGKTFVIAGRVQTCGLKGGNNENWKGVLKMPGTLTTQL